MVATRLTAREDVLAGVLRAHSTTRQEVAASTGLSSATVSRAIDILIAEGVVRESSDIATGLRGRRAVRLEVVANRAHVAGIDLGASTTRIVIADLLARPVAVRRLPTRVDLGPKPLAEWLHEKIEETAGAALSISALRIGVPGAVAAEDRRVTNAPNLSQVEDPLFLSTLDTATNASVDIDNDANYALLGEQKFGAAQSSPTAGMLTVGTGLGAAISIDGRILRGRRGIIGEFGHLLVGPLGTRLENMVTGPMLSRRAAELGYPLGSPAELFQQHLPSQLSALVSEFDHALLVALTALIVSSDPAVVVLGGGIAKSLGPRLKNYEQELERNLHIEVPILLAALDDYSGAVGAVVAGLQKVYSDMGVTTAELPSLPDSRSVNWLQLASSASR